MSRPPAVLTGASRTPYWLDQAESPQPRASLNGEHRTSLAVVGGGFTGLWAALMALEEQPGRSVSVLEAHTLGWAASGRNGGFCAASLTHGLPNGLERWPHELKTLTELGLENLDAIEETIKKYEIDCDFQRSGELEVAIEPWQVDSLAQTHQLALEMGESSEFLTAEQTRKLVDSSTYLAGRFDARGIAMVDPAKLVWGLAKVIEQLGGIVYEKTRVTGIKAESDVVRIQTTSGEVSADQVVLGTSVFPSPVKRHRPYIVPVWDHVLMTEPLSSEQRTAIGWQSRHGISDYGNLFHYYRLTKDGRLLFGGYDAWYYFGKGLGASKSQNEKTEKLLAQHLVDTFPELSGIKITHTWGGAIDTCSRFSAFWGVTHGGRVASVQGFTGLGVGASRFGAQVCLDLLAGRDNVRTNLEMVRKKPLPFPPEPVRWAGIQFTKSEIARADRSGGQRGLWLKFLDKIGLGFDS